MWLLHEILVIQVRPPFALKWVDSTTELWSVVEWDTDEAEWSVQLCSLETQPVMGAAAHWPSDLIAKTPSRRRPVQFDGTRFVGGPVRETIGPEDADGDGFPGISIRVAHPRIGSGDVFVAQSAELAWDGVLGDDGSIRGTVTYVPSQELLGASRWWLRRPLPMRPADGGSTFELIPGAPGLTCGGLLRTPRGS